MAPQFPPYPTFSAISSPQPKLSDSTSSNLIPIIIVVAVIFVVFTLLLCGCATARRNARSSGNRQIQYGSGLSQKQQTTQHSSWHGTSNIGAIAGTTNTHASHPHSHHHHHHGHHHAHNAALMASNTTSSFGSPPPYTPS